MRGNSSFSTSVRSGADAILPYAAAAVLLSLSFETIPLPLRAQISPLSTLLAAAFLPVALLSSAVRRRSPLLWAVVTFVTFAIVHSVVALSIDRLVVGPDPIRTLSWLRQVAALVAGSSVFVVLRAGLPRIGERRFAVLTLIGATPALLVGMCNVVWGVFGARWAEVAVKAIRKTLVPFGGSWQYRAAGVSLEPSHFSFYLLLVVLPVAAALVWQNGRSRLAVAGALLLAGISFAWACSITGYAALVTMLACVAAVHGRRRWALGALVVVSLVAALLVIAFPAKNYFVLSAFWLVPAIRNSNPAALLPSATVVIYGTLGPFVRAFSSLNLIGYGLGGTATHLSAMVPPSWLHDIQAASWAGMPGLPTSLGRVFAETGLVGLLLYARLWFLGWKTLGRKGPRASVSLAIAASTALVGLAVIHVLKIGSYAVPYIWMWLALIDSLERHPSTQPTGFTARARSGS